MTSKFLTGRTVAKIFLKMKPSDKENCCKDKDGSCQESRETEQGKEVVGGGNKGVQYIENILKGY